MRNQHRNHARPRCEGLTSNQPSNVLNAAEPINHKYGAANARHSSSVRGRSRPLLRPSLQCERARFGATATDFNHQRLVEGDRARSTGAPAISTGSDSPVNDACEELASVHDDTI